MNIIFHALINVLVGFGLHLSGFDIFLLGLAAVVIDIDHVFYSYFSAGNKTVAQMISWHKKEYKLLRQHLYIFHTLEMLVILLLFSLYLNQHLFIFFVGFAIHVFVDMGWHFVNHKSISELAQFTLFYWIFK